MADVELCAGFCDKEGKSDVQIAIEEVETLIKDVIFQLADTSPDTMHSKSLASSSSVIVSNLKDAMQRLEEFKSNDAMLQNVGAKEERYTQQRQSHHTTHHVMQ